MPQLSAVQTLDKPEILDIEALAQPTHDETARQRFVSAIRKHSIVEMPKSLQSDYEGRVLPGLAARGRAPANWREIDAAMEAEASYRFYSSMRYNAQEMCFQSVQEPVERALPKMIEVARAAADTTRSGGSLRLDPTLDIPRYVSALDVHLTPGCFHSEYTPDDVAQGAVISLGSKVFSAISTQRSMFGGVGKAIGRWVKTHHPEVNVRRVLDIGTSSGKNLFPYTEIFPGVESHGIDVGAPLLRYGHAMAENLGLPIHFSQQNAETLDFPDGHFDLIVSSFFFHEIPVKSTRRILAECYRLLAPGGIMVHQELPSEGLVDAWENYFWNWDTINNNEPSYTAFRAQDPYALLEEAGFDRDTAFATLLADVGGYPDRSEPFGWDEPGRPMHGRGAWYVFGGKKPA